MKEHILNFILFALIISCFVAINGCTTYEQVEPCPPKSDTQIISETISDILVPKARWGC